MASILQASRKSHQENAVDTFRRQQLAKGLMPNTSAAQPCWWGAFLELGPASSQPPFVDGHAVRGAAADAPADATAHPVCSSALAAPAIPSYAGSRADNSAHCPPASSGSASPQAGGSTHCASAFLGNASSTAAEVSHVACVLPPSCSFVESNDPRRSRLRPTRGSSSRTASSSVAAVLALVGPTAAKSRGGSTRGQPH